MPTPRIEAMAAASFLRGPSAVIPISRRSAGVSSTWWCWGGRRSRRHPPLNPSPSPSPDPKPSHQRVEVELLPNEDARVLAEAEPLQPRDQLVALVAAASPRAPPPPPPAQVAVALVLVHDARVERVQVGAAAEAAEGVHLRAGDGGGVPIAREGRHPCHVGLGPRERVRVEHVDRVVGRHAPQARGHAPAVAGDGRAAPEDEDAPAARGCVRGRRSVGRRAGAAAVATGGMHAASGTCRRAVPCARRAGPARGRRWAARSKTWRWCRARACPAARSPRWRRRRRRAWCR